MSKDEIKRKYRYLKDIVGGSCWNLKPGEVTDDTMMTIAVAEGILDNPENPIEDIGKHFIKWYDSKLKDIGNIIRIALGEYKQVFQLSKDELMSTGYVFDTLICALWCLINTSSFEDAVCEAANLGGDADTIADVTGGMAGVYYGYDAIPARWKKKTLVKDQLIYIAQRFFEG
ncbi:ADP-ribosylglycohydrolase family protein [Tepidimicrobium xylanilyticum]|uniref:ADP-ribosylglycohydrolase n=1 Tax=Tepidimicrobium xylanilyticum TaxID=1123352 RepID=A0A1H2WUL3_9FIRM|nr:ADP-ribosylglycohydrolase family protein [Tepidimicrobium xylanilyticum]GMG97963.1 hypothetical protein EN5CB1_27890 [Tepidimicrobium xylanilyticum]SDW83944.1 ADP-ribosylglycohydrolase [Tepidimicrobium xylanilyticum]